MDEPNDGEGKGKHKKAEVKEQRILIGSIKDHLLPFILELKNSTKLYGTLVGLYIIDNIR